MDRKLLIRRRSARALDALESPGDGRSVLVTLVHTEGSCYLKAGAQLVLSEQGEIFGVVSGGCLEQAIVDEAEEVLEAAASRLSTYDTSDPSDIDFGFGMGCGGKLWAFFEFLPDRNCLETILRDVRPFEAIVLAAPEREWVGRRFHPGQEIADRLDARLAHHLSEGVVGARSDLIEENVEGQSWTFALLRRPLRPALTIFGAGPGSWPLAAIAQTMGWSLQVYDHRIDLLEDFPKHLSSVALLKRGESPPSDRLGAAVVMSHHFSRDLEILADLLRQDWSYIGVLGSPKRCRALREALAERHPEFSLNRVFPQLHAPAGLYLGGDRIEAIALSIAAQIEASLYL